MWRWHASVRKGSREQNAKSLMVRCHCACKDYFLYINYKCGQIADLEFCNAPESVGFQLKNSSRKKTLDEGRQLNICLFSKHCSVKTSPCKCSESVRDELLQGEHCEESPPLNRYDNVAKLTEALREAKHGAEVLQFQANLDIPLNYTENAELAGQSIQRKALGAAIENGNGLILRQRPVKDLLGRVCV